MCNDGGDPSLARVQSILKMVLVSWRQALAINKAFSLLAAILGGSAPRGGALSNIAASVTGHLGGWDKSYTCTLSHQ